MHVPLLALAMTALALPLTAQSAPRATTTLPAAEFEKLQRLREDVWLAWFSGNLPRLRELLGPELVAVSPDSERWQSLEETLSGSAAFRERGNRLQTLSFEHTITHQFDRVVVMFSQYALEWSDAVGARTTQRGRATEVFVRVGSRWVHTSWHLDVPG